MSFATIFDQLGSTVGTGINTGVSTYVNSLLPRSVSGNPAPAGSGQAVPASTGMMGLSTTEIVIGSIVVVVLILAAFKAAKKAAA